MTNFDNVFVMLRLNLSEEEFNKNEKLREKVDDFVRIVNDRLVDKFKEEINFDATFDENNFMVFTIDCGKNSVLTEINKTIDKLLTSKKFTSFSNRVVSEEELKA